MNKPRLPLSLFLVLPLLLGLIIAGCSNTTSDSAFNYIGETVVTPSPTPLSPYPSSSEVLAYYFPSDIVNKMKADSAPFIAQYGGLNVMSTSMYGRAFITGTASIKDVFDARIPQNYTIFQRYAYDNFGIKATPYFYERYAEAANKFIQECGYDAVIFHPDELHPVFTDPTTDTWMLLRDCPTNSADIFYSTRVTDRKIAIQGGVEMKMMTATDPLYSKDWMYYVPNNVNDYTPYAAPSKAQEVQEKLTFATSNYAPQDASADALNKRVSLGIVESPLLSNKTIQVGGWKQASLAQDMVTSGISFRNNPNSGTWGGWGLYVLALDARYWTE
ncbi:MAG: hypothetical protein RDV48_05270 [Candidatus Eremiobacteraeota bacterium]|nr:hypothetical protein [Candidatus Eremiobacteraeota bacterium]